MDSYLDTPFLLEEPQHHSSQPHETWKMQFGQQPVNPFQQSPHSSAAQHRLGSHDGSSSRDAMSQLEADVAFFASSAPGGATTSDGNALGLMGSFDAPPSPTSQPVSVGMSHSHSMPSSSSSSYDFAHHMGGGMHHQLRRESGSNVSEHSQHSSSHGSHYEGNSPRSLTPAQSPMGLPLSLSGMSGLALGTPLTPARSLGSVSPFSGGHDALLSLSRGSDHMAPPPPSLKRRVTGLGHSVYTNVKPEDENDDDDDADFDDATPMPPSTEQFKGQRASHLTGPPITPLNPGRTSIGSLSSSCDSHHPTPGHSYSNSTTPDESYRSAGGSLGPFESPFGRLHRLHSFDDDAAAAASPMQHGSQTYDRSLESMWADKEKSAIMMSNALSPFGRANMSLPGASAMSRTSSAPMLSLATHSHYAPMPETPVRGLMQAPSTPANEHHLLLSPAYDGTFSAPMMMPSRSLSSLHSPVSVSPMSLVENMPRRTTSDIVTPAAASSSSTPGGVTRTATPRSRARNTGPPPLIVSSADKMHVCHCGKRFKRMEHLKRHNRTHTQERPHRCPVETCGKWFGRTDNLAQHLKTHYRAVGGRSAELMALTKGEDVTAASLQSSEPRHNPHAAASAAAAVASKVVAAAANKRRSNTLSNDALGGAITLNRRTMPNSRQVLSPTGSVSANSSPVHSTAGPIQLNWQ